MAPKKAPATRRNPALAVNPPAAVNAIPAAAVEEDPVFVTPPVVAQAPHPAAPPPPPLAPAPANAAFETTVLRGLASLQDQISGQGRGSRTSENPACATLISLMFQAKTQGIFALFGLFMVSFAYCYAHRGGF